MVNFRYHLVSIIAVFLALVLGIVLGSYTINPRVIDNLHHQVNTLRSDKSGLRGQVLGLQSQVNRDSGFVSAVTPQLVANRLRHQRVVIVAMPGASSGVVGSVRNAVTSAGGKVATVLSVNGAWTDPTQVALLGDLALRLAKPGTPVGQTSAYVRAARVLASALIGPGGLTGADSTILSGFGKAKLVKVAGVPAKGTVAVVVAGDGVLQPTDADTAAATELLDIPIALDAAGRGTVVVGSSTADSGSGLVHLIRMDKVLRATLSTVDDADTATGVLRTILALAAQVRGVSGQYGVGPDASAQAPVPSPTPSP